MRPFNLAETRILERNYCQVHVNRRLQIMGLMIVITLVVTGVSLVCKSMFASQVRETKTSLVKAQERCVRAKRDMSIVNVNLSESKWQNQLAGESKRWLTLLESALSSVPADMWLNSIENSEKDMAISISGETSSFDSIAMFINTLRCTRRFGEVRLESAKISSRNGTPHVGFILAVKLKGASAPAAGSPSVGEPTADPPATELPDGPGPVVQNGKVPLIQGPI